MRQGAVGWAQTKWIHRKIMTNDHPYRPWKDLGRHRRSELVCLFRELQRRAPFRRPAIIGAQRVGDRTPGGRSQTYQHGNFLRPFSARDVHHDLYHATAGIAQTLANGNQLIFGRLEAWDLETVAGAVVELPRAGES